MTAAKEYASSARQRVTDARLYESHALVAAAPEMLVFHAQHAALSWTMALISLLRFVNALPEPVAIPPVPQPSEEARRRGLLVGAVVTRGEVGVETPRSEHVTLAGDAS